MVAMNIQQLSLTIDCVYHINTATTIAVYTYCTQYINYLAGIAWLYSSCNQNKPTKTIAIDHDVRVLGLVSALYIYKFQQLFRSLSLRFRISRILSCCLRALFLLTSRQCILQLKLDEIEDWPAVFEVCQVGEMCQCLVDCVS
jgi:hypothetical protein